MNEFHLNKTVSSGALYILLTAVKVTYELYSLILDRCFFLSSLFQRLCRNDQQRLLKREFTKIAKGGFIYNLPIAYTISRSLE
jgi:hypothetical protein